MSANLKRKRLIIIIAVLVVVIAIIVILASVFSVRQVRPIVHDFSGGMILHPDDAPTANDVLAMSKGKSIVFLSKDSLLDNLNAKFTQWHAFAIVKNFPNILEVHFVKRQAAIKIDIGGNMVYVDSFGYVTDNPAEGDCLDVSSAFEHRDAEVNIQGQQLKFVDSAYNERLSIVLEYVIASWRCNIELTDLPEIVGKENVLTFDGEGNLIVSTRAGAKIKIKEPSANLTNRLLSAYSVYYNDKLNLQQNGVVITVEKNGNIITPNTNK